MLGDIEQVSPAGKLSVRETVPVKPLIAVTMIDEVPDPGAATVTVDGVAVIVSQQSGQRPGLRMQGR